jgi:nucleotide-binding universal stress UspA family protein
MFERILLAIDNSPSSEVTIAFASAFAKHSSAKIHVFHVNEFLVNGRGLTLETKPEAIDLLTRAVNDLSQQGVVVSASCRVAARRQVAQEIADESERRNSDVIILGSFRRRRLQRLLCSGVRERTTRLVTLPVLIAPSPLDSRCVLKSGLQELAKLQVDLAHRSVEAR